MLVYIHSCYIRRLEGQAIQIFSFVICQESTATTRWPYQMVVEVRSKVHVRILCPSPIEQSKLAGFL
jgi:hypothetical protein